MTQAAPSGAPAARDGGFALILVLWLLVLLSAIGIHLAATGRTETRIAANVVAAAQAEALADGGVARAVVALGDPDPGQRWAADGRPHEISSADGRLWITIHNENGKINPNVAPDKLLVALFRRVGAGDKGATALAAAINARLRPNSVANSAVAGAPAAGDGTAGAGAPGAAPMPAPFDTLDDLAELPGMTPALLAAARPHLSIYATTALPAPDAMDPLVRAAVAEFQAGSADAGAVAASVPSKMTVAIRSTARTPRGGVFTREAIVRVEPAAAKGYVALRWTRGATPVDTDRLQAAQVRD